MTYELSTTWTILLIAAIVWEFIWKGIALWRAAHHDQPVWFWVMLLVSTVGILPIIYLITHHEYTEHRTVAGKGAV